MSRTLIETGNLVVNLKPSPIEPSWIIEGNPVAQSCALSHSADGVASTIVWECSEGKFNWYYDFDETILVLEGSIVLCRGPGQEAGVLSQDQSGHARLRAAGVLQDQANAGAGRQAPARELDGHRLRGRPISSGR